MILHASNSTSAEFSDESRTWKEIEFAEGAELGSIERLKYKVSKMGEESYQAVKRANKKADRKMQLAQDVEKSKRQREPSLYFHPGLEDCLYCYV